MAAAHWATVAALPCSRCIRRCNHTSCPAALPNCPERCRRAALLTDLRQAAQPRSSGCTMQLSPEGRQRLPHGSSTRSALRHRCCKADTTTCAALLRQLSFECSASRAAHLPAWLLVLDLLSAPQSTAPQPLPRSRQAKVRREWRSVCHINASGAAVPLTASSTAPAAWHSCEARHSKRQTGDCAWCQRLCPQQVREVPWIVNAWNSSVTIATGWVQLMSSGALSAPCQSRRQHQSICHTSPAAWSARSTGGRAAAAAPCARAPAAGSDHT